MLLKCSERVWSCINACMWSYWSYGDAMPTDLHLFNRSFVRRGALLTDLLLAWVMIVRMQRCIRRRKLNQQAPWSDLSGKCSEFKHVSIYIKIIKMQPTYSYYLYEVSSWQRRCLKCEPQSLNSPQIRFTKYNIIYLTKDMRT